MKVFLYRKNNAVRFMAIVLAFIMLAVPFFAHAGFKGDSKAAPEGGDTNTQKKYEYNTTVTLDNVIKNPSIAYENDELIIKSDNGHITLETTDHQYDSKYVDIYVNNVINSVSGDINAVAVTINNETKNLSASLTDCEVYYKKSTEGEDALVMWKNNSKVQIPAGNLHDQITIQFYIKVVVYETTDNGKSKYGDVLVHLADVKFTENPIEENSVVPCFKSSGAKVSADEYYKSATLENNTVMQQFKYGYVKEDGTFVEGNNTVNQTGVYKPCAIYYAGTTYSVDNIIKKFYGTPVKIDATAPDFELSIVKKNVDGSQIGDSVNVKKKDDGIGNFESVYVNNANNDLYVRVKPTDGTDECASGIQGVSVNGVEVNSTSDVDGKNVYDVAISSLPGNSEIIVTDKVGHTTTKTMQYINDIKLPDITEQKACLSDNSAELDSTKWYRLDNNSVKLTATITDDYYVDKVQLYIKSPKDPDYILYNDNDNAVSLEYAPLNDTTNATATVTLSADKCKDTGEYSFYFTALDKAGNEGSGNSTANPAFKLDNIEPTAKLSYEISTKKDDGDNWVDWQTWNPDPATGKYTVNKDGITAGNVQYRIKVDAEDVNSGYDHDNSGKVNLDGTAVTKLQYISDPNAPNTNPQTLAYMIQPDDVSETESTITIRIKDTAGNCTDKVTEKIVAADKKIDFKSNTLEIYETVDPNNKIELGSFLDGDPVDININKSYTIAIDAYSGYEIERESAKLSATISEAIDGKMDLEIDGVVNNLTFDTTTGKYTAKITYEVPGSVICGVKNEELKNIKLSVTDKRYTPPDTGTDDTAEITIGKILYDMSLPRLDIDKLKILKDGKEEAIEDKWYQQAKIAYTIVSKPCGTNVESGLSSISWEITGSEKNDKGNVNNLQGVNNYGGMIDIPESTGVNGTVVTFSAKDRADNSIFTDNNANIAVIKVDKHEPSITSLTVNDKEDNEHTASYVVLPVVKAGAKDNLTLDKIVIEVKYPDGVVRSYTETVNWEGKDLIDDASYTIEQVNGKTLDGNYTASAYAVDKSGRKSPVSVNSFVIDATKPVVTSKIIEGTASSKTAVPYYYKDNVGIELTYTDANVSADKVTVTDNGNAIGNIKWEPVSGTDGKYRAVIYVSDEGKHSITINAKDTSGNVAVESKQEFVIDKTKPQVTAYVNGTTVYNDSMGNMMLTGNTSVAMNISDATADTDDSYVQVQRSTPSEGAGNPAYVKNGNAGMSFGEESDYVVNFYTIDRAGNSSDVKTVRFRIDKTSPELSINGAAGGTSASASTVTFTMKETFWSDANATVTIYRKASDGAKEELYKTLRFNPSAYQTSMSETLTETGVYRFEFEAGDNVGHHSELSQTLIIDRDAPVVSLTGVNDYDMTDGAVEFVVEITDAFYSSKKVSITGTRTDREGKTNKLDFGRFIRSANPTVISKTFDEEGIYFITLETEDAAGNRHANTVHFVIDNTAPVIGDLSKYDGKTFTNFSWDEDLDELVSDLTVCDVQMLLNGSEYDGVSDIEDGSYVLLIAATDEMGHKTEKEARFELDTKAPVFIITGVEDEEVKNEDYIINVSLQLEEDTLESVVLNGTNIPVKNNTATINVTEKGEYTLELKSHDAAGNEATETITFKYGEEKSLWWLWIVIASCVFLAGTIIIIIVKNKKKQ